MTPLQLMLVSVLATASSASLVYKASLNGAEEVPPVTTKASGIASVSLINTTYALGYFYATNINQMTRAHLHAGAVGKNGPTIAWAFNATYGPISGLTFAFNRSINNVSALLAAGLVYFSIHTEANPSGELRGQLAGPGSISYPSPVSPPPSPPLVAFSLPALPYDYTALLPYIDNATIVIHHTKHHQTYVNNLNTAVAKYPSLASLGLVGLSQAAGTNAIPADVATAVMAAPSDANASSPSPDLESAIAASFGSLDAMKSAFNAASLARFGSGWAWLGLRADGTLGITSTANQDNPLMTAIVPAAEQMIPILGLDVREHGCYLKYQNLRTNYVTAFWSVVNPINSNFAGARNGSVPT